VGRKFDVDEMNAWWWPYEKLGGISKNVQYPHMEADLYQCITNMWKNGFAVWMEMLQFKGCRLARNHNTSDREFIVSYGWVRRLLAWHDLTNRHQTMTAQRLLDAYEERLVSF
jgi:hypothetical protein